MNKINEIAEQIKVLILKTNSNELEVVENFIPTVKNIQKVVGGRFEAIELIRYPDSSEITLWLNEEGKVIPLQPNFNIAKQHNGELLDVIMGDVLITTCNSMGETKGLTNEQIEYVKKRFNLNLSNILLRNNEVNRTYLIG